MGKAEKRRHDIASVATRLYIERGYANVTAEDISAEVGIGVRTFFRYFATKEDAAFPDHEDRVARFTDALHQQRGSSDPIDAVARVSASSVRDYFDDPELYRRRYLLVNSEPALRTHERVANSAYEGAIADYLDVELGENAQTHLFTRALAAAIVAAVDTILDEWAQDATVDTDVRIGELRELIAGFAAAAPGAPANERGDLVLVLADDPHLRRDLARVVDAHRHIISPPT